MILVGDDVGRLINTLNFIYYTVCVLSFVKNNIDHTRNWILATCMCNTQSAEPTSFSQLYNGRPYRHQQGTHYTTHLQLVSDDERQWQDTIPFACGVGCFAVPLMPSLYRESYGHGRLISRTLPQHRCVAIVVTRSLKRVPEPGDWPPHLYPPSFLQNEPMEGELICLSDTDHPLFSAAGIKCGGVA
jgi:hypothetical protein